MKRLVVPKKSGKRACNLGPPPSLGHLVLVGAFTAYLRGTPVDLEAFAMGEYLGKKSGEAPIGKEVLRLGFLAKCVISAGRVVRFVPS